MNKRQIFEKANTDKFLNCVMPMKNNPDIAVIKTVIPDAYKVTKNPLTIKCKGSDGNIDIIIHSNHGKVNLIAG